MLTFFVFYNSKKGIQNPKISNKNITPFSILVLFSPLSTNEIDGIHLLFILRINYCFRGLNQLFLGVKTVNLRVKLTTAFIWKLLQNQTNMNWEKCS